MDFSTLWVASDALKIIIMFAQFAVALHWQSYTKEYNARTVQRLCAANAAISVAFHVGSHDPFFAGWIPYALLLNLHTEMTIIGGLFVVSCLVAATYKASMQKPPKWVIILYWIYAIVTFLLMQMSTVLLVLYNSFAGTGVRSFTVGIAFLAAGVHFEASLMTLRGRIRKWTAAKTSVIVSVGSDTQVPDSYSRSPRASINAGTTAQGPSRKTSILGVVASPRRQSSFMIKRHSLRNSIMRRLGIAAVAHQSKIAVPGESPVTNYRDSPFRPALPPKRHSLPLSVHVSPYSPYSPPGTPDALLARKFTAVSGKGIITGTGTGLMHVNDDTKAIQLDAGSVNTANLTDQPTSISSGTTYDAQGLKTNANTTRRTSVKSDASSVARRNDEKDVKMIVVEGKEVRNNKRKKKKLKRATMASKWLAKLNRLIICGWILIFFIVVGALIISYVRLTDKARNSKPFSQSVYEERAEYNPSNDFFLYCLVVVNGYYLYYGSSAKKKDKRRVRGRN
ncbi:hypothetical protein AAMO2058_000477500 [Amorphochlora amoebiformis]